MSFSKKIAMLILILIIISVAGCSCKPEPPVKDDSVPAKPAGKEYQVALYFSDRNLSGLVAQPATVIADNPDQVPAKAVEALLKGPSDSRAIRLFPSGVKLLSLKVSQGLATVNLSGFSTSGSENEDLLLVTSLVNTLTAIDGIKQVQILIEGVNPIVIGAMDVSEPLVKDDSKIN